MKKIVLLLSILFFASNYLFCQKDTAGSAGSAQRGVKINPANNDTISPAKPSAETKDVDRAVTSNNPVAVASTTSAVCPCNDRGEVTGTLDWLLVFTPVLLFVLLLLILFFGKSLTNFDFQGALAENEIAKHTLINPEYTKKEDGTGGIIALASLGTPPSNLHDILPPTINVTIIPPGTEAKDNYRPSISRFIAFFSGMLTVIIAVCMASFFVYHYIRTNCAPDLSALSIVLIALGLGVTPYAINKISGAVSSRKSEE